MRRERQHAALVSDGPRLAPGGVTVFPQQMAASDHRIVLITAPSHAAAVSRVTVTRLVTTTVTRRHRQQQEFLPVTRSSYS